MKVGDLVYVKRRGKKIMGMITKKQSDPRDTMYWVIQVDGSESWHHHLRLERLPNEGR